MNDLQARTRGEPRRHPRLCGTEAASAAHDSGRRNGRRVAAGGAPKLTCDVSGRGRTQIAKRGEKDALRGGTGRAARIRTCDTDVLEIRTRHGLIAIWAATAGRATSAAMRQRSRTARAIGSTYLWLIAKSDTLFDVIGGG